MLPVAIGWNGPVAAGKRPCIRPEGRRLALNRILAKGMLLLKDSHQGGNEA